MLKKDLEAQHMAEEIHTKITAIKNQVYVTQDFNLEYITLKEFNKESITFDSFINFITSITIGDEND